MSAAIPGPGWGEPSEGCLLGGAGRVGPGASASRGWQPLQAAPSSRGRARVTTRHAVNDGARHREVSARPPCSQGFTRAHAHDSAGRRCTGQQQVGAEGPARGRPPASSKAGARLTTPHRRRPPPPAWLRDTGPGGLRAGGSEDTCLSPGCSDRNHGLALHRGVYPSQFWGWKSNLKAGDGRPPSWGPGEGPPASPGGGWCPSAPSVPRLSPRLLWFLCVPSLPALLSRTHEGT